MTQTSGDSGSSFEEPTTTDFEIRLIHALVIDSESESREEIVTCAKMRGYEVTILESPDIDDALGEHPVEILLIRLSNENAERSAIEQCIRRVLRLFRSEGVVVLGVTTADADESQLNHWLQAGVDTFLYLGAPTSDVQMLAAEHATKRRRSRLRAQKEVTASLRRYETFYLNGPEAQIIVAKRDNRILDSSLRVKSVLGWRREEMNGRHLSLIFPDLFRENELIQAGEKAKKEGHPSTVSGINHRHPDGGRCLLEARIAPVPWADEEALSVTFLDVTTVRTKQGRRMRSAKLDTVSTMANGIADDLSNLLTAVRGNLSLIGKQPTLGRDARALLHDAEGACNSADELVASMRLLARSNVSPARPDQRSLEPRYRKPIAMGSFLERIVSFELLGSQVRPFFQMDDGLWHIEGDDVQIEQAVRAIIANAVDAMPNGGQLRVLAANYEAPTTSDGQPARYVLLSIVDDGPGIPKEFLTHVFDPYFSTRSDRAGLGLALSQAIMRSHSGIIDIELAPVRGTIVRIYLPAAALESSTKEEAESLDLPVGPSTAEAVRRKRVLVMDDDKDIRTITKKILASHGFDVYCTQDGREAIDVYLKADQMGAPFDVALFDLDVRGGMGGKDAVARLRRQFPAVKVILMTGYVDDILLENHREHGFSGVITKPFQIDKLIATISQFAAAGSRS